MSAIDLEVLAIIYGLNDKTSSRRRWLNFTDTISVYKNIVFEHIKGKENELADQLSRLQLGINK